LNTLPNFARKPWSYGRDIHGREYLKADSDFEALVQEIEVALTNTRNADVRFRLEPTSGKYDHDDPLLKRLLCRRATWTAPLDATLLDKFFNGLMGIRAQYYASPYHGSAMNAKLLAALRPRLLEIAAQQACSQSDERLARDSFVAASAKAWICEKNLSGMKIIRASDLDLHEEEIQNDWLDIARAVTARDVPQGQYQLYSAALNGVRAPIADQFEVKRGWITHEQVEYVTPAKHDRDCQVFMFGFT
jgi:hypothetical protein